MEAVRTYQITLPSGDAAFLRKQAERMGWELKNVPSQKKKSAKGYEAAMRDIAAGRVRSFNSTEDLFNDLGI